PTANIGVRFPPTTCPLLWGAKAHSPPAIRVSNSPARKKSISPPAAPRRGFSFQRMAVSVGPLLAHLLCRETPPPEFLRWSAMRAIGSSWWVATTRIRPIPNESPPLLSTMEKHGGLLLVNPAGSVRLWPSSTMSEWWPLGRTAKMSQMIQEPTGNILIH